MGMHPIDDLMRRWQREELASRADARADNAAYGRAV